MKFSTAAPTGTILLAAFTFIAYVGNPCAGKQTVTDLSYDRNCRSIGVRGLARPGYNTHHNPQFDFPDPNNGIASLADGDQLATDLVRLAFNWNTGVLHPVGRPKFPRRDDLAQG